MMAKRRTKASLWVYLAPAAAIVVLVLARVLFTGPRDGLSTAVRGLALAGYGLLFLSIFSAGYLRELVRRFGRPFVTLHHLMSLSGLALVTAHFVAVARQWGTLFVYVPQANAGLAFLANGGRIALALIIVAALAAWARSRFKSAWRAVHLLNYLAFWLATAHANLLGQDTQVWAIRTVTLLMAAAVAWVAVRRRLPARKPSN